MLCYAMKPKKQSRVSRHWPELEKEGKKKKKRNSKKESVGDIEER